MYIAHIQSGLSPEHGGPARSLENYCRSQANSGHRVSVWTLEGYANASAAKVLAPPIEMHIATVSPPSRLGHSAALLRELKAAESPDIYHLHGSWSLILRHAAKEAKRRHKPYVLEPMGMFEPWSLQQRWLQKRIARWVYQDGLLHGADCLHVNSVLEAQHIRELGFTRPIAVIPAGVDLAELEAQNADLSDACPWPALSGKRYFLYLSRLHPKKRLDMLIRVWGKLSERFPDWRLAIAGTGDKAYVDECQKLAKELRIEDKCFWAGHVSEREKSWLYAHAHCYVLPTFSENFGNTVAEALAHQTPVITTTETPWTDLRDFNCGWLIDSDESKLTSLLEEVLTMPDDKRRQMGQNGLALVHQRYSLDSVNRAILDLYTWLLGAGPKPAHLLT
jgi:glycosyltransferase involved in cell wall biosynthesis